MAKTIKSALRSFVASWGSSVTSRLRAARIYADAANHGDSNAKAQFWRLDGFQNWTPQQWRLLYWIGCGTLSAKFIDVKEPSVPLTMQQHKIPLIMQEHIFNCGLSLACADGSVAVLSYRSIQQHHIEQVFDENGNERTVEEQIAIIRSREKNNLEFLDPGKLRVRHACVLDSTDIYEALKHKPALLGPEALLALAAYHSQGN